jgi:hypothetical protein
MKTRARPNGQQELRDTAMSRALVRLLALTSLPLCHLLPACQDEMEEARGRWTSSGEKCTPETCGDPVWIEAGADPGDLDGPCAAGYTGCGGVNLEGDSQDPNFNKSYEDQVVVAVNEARAGNGLPPLKRMGSLVYAARYHAKDMHDDIYFDHDTWDPDPLHFVCSMADRLISYYGSSWSWLAENIARGYSTPQAVMAGWLGSPGHYSNIMHTELREIGVGYYGGYWVQDFASQQGIVHLIINNDAAETTRQFVTLYIGNRSAAYPWTTMCLRNHTETSWKLCIPYQSEYRNWELPDWHGDHTVYAEVSRGAVKALLEDAIHLESPNPDPRKKTFLPGIYK